VSVLLCSILIRALSGQE